jgi:hypothetical protein
MSRLTRNEKVAGSIPAGGPKTVLPRHNQLRILWPESVDFVSWGKHWVNNPPCAGILRSRRE